MFDRSNTRHVAARRRARAMASRRTHLHLESLEDRCLLASDPNIKLVDSGDDWKYLDDGTDQGTAWRAVGFDDTAWLSGPSELGYGEGDEATTVGFGPDSANKYITTYFRRKFQVNNPVQIGVLTAEIERDDAVVVFLNGQEVVHDPNLPGVLGDNSVIFSTRATAAIDETLGFVKFTIDPAKLVPGENTLAVEVHQTLPDSTDISFDMKLTAGRTKFVVSNTADSGTGSLRQAIADSAGNPGNPHIVSFEIPGGGVQQIVLSSLLQNLTDPITYTVPAGTEIQIGTNAPNAPTIGQSNNTTKAGDGILTLGGNLNRTINTQLNITGGLLQVLADPGVRTTVNVQSGGQMASGANQTYAALNVNAGGKMKMNVGNHVMVTNALTVNATGQFDITDNDVIVQATAAARNTVYNNVRGWIATGAANLQWNGNGIMSSAAGNDPNLLTAVGAILNDNGQGGPFYTTFSTKTVNANSTLLKYTYYGDADLSGIVDGTDYALTDNGFNAVLAGWFNGDFDYTVPIGGTDYALIDNAFNSQGGPLRAVDEALALRPVGSPGQTPPRDVERPIVIRPDVLAAVTTDWTFAADDSGLPLRRRR